MIEADLEDLGFAFPVENGCELGTLGAGAFIVSKTLLPLESKFEPRAMTPR